MAAHANQSRPIIADRSKVVPIGLTFQEAMEVAGLLDRYRDLSSL
jgi:hypothetical protein